MQTQPYYKIALRVLLSLVFITACGAPAASPGQSNPAQNPAADNSSMAPSSAASNTAATGPIVVLIVDDYSELAAFDPSQVSNDDLIRFGQFKGLNCVALPDGQGGVYAPRKAGKGDPPIPHGSAVYETALNELSQSGAIHVESTHIIPTQVSFVPAENVQDNLQLWERDSGGYIVIATVHAPDFSTEGVANGIANAINEFSSNGIPILHDGAFSSVSGFVINLSFALIPCDPLFGSTLTDLMTPDPAALLAEYWSWFDGYQKQVNGEEQDPEDEKYVRDLYIEKKLQELDAQLMQAGGDPQKLFEVWVNLLLDPNLGPLRLFAAYTNGYLSGGPGNDGLASMLASPPTELPVVTVASAGNIGLPQPYEPAIWPQVLSVSAASFDNAQVKADWSNSGEVMMGGFATDQNGGLMLDNENNLVLGTSFSAPRLSIHEALYLLHSLDLNCSGDQNIEVSPPLNTNQWNNLELSEAAVRYCTEFEAG